MTSMPTLFISHGSPMLALEDAPTTKFLRDISKKLPRPKAILVASAHWETENPMLTGAENLFTKHDFYGFPEELYKLQYPAKGDPQLAADISNILREVGFVSGLDAHRGLDHGAWNPLLLMYPEADIPVIELSIQPLHDAKWHYNIGRALAKLREKNILIIGTGNLTHNLREIRNGYKKTPQWVSDFSSWVEENLKEHNIENLLQWESQAPYAKQNHPTPEHFLPFFVSLGAAGEDLKQVKKLHDDVTLGVLAMDAYAFGNLE